MKMISIVGEKTSEAQSALSKVPVFVLLKRQGKVFEVLILMWSQSRHILPIQWDTTGAFSSIFEGNVSSDLTTVTQRVN